MLHHHQWLCVCVSWWLLCLSWSRCCCCRKLQGPELSPPLCSGSLWATSAFDDRKPSPKEQTFCIVNLTQPHVAWEAQKQNSSCLDINALAAPVPNPFYFNTIIINTFSGEAFFPSPRSNQTNKSLHLFECVFSCIYAAYLSSIIGAYDVVLAGKRGTYWLARLAHVV